MSDALAICQRNTDAAAKRDEDARERAKREAQAMREQFPDIAKFADALRAEFGRLAGMRIRNGRKILYEVGTQKFLY